jgi:hypothetical protein
LGNEGMMFKVPGSKFQVSSFKFQVPSSNDTALKLETTLEPFWNNSETILKPF